MKKIIKNKYIILIPIIILNIISLIYLKNTPYFKKQLIIYIISLITLLITSKLNYKYIKKFIIPSYIVTTILLIYVLLFGKNINGAKAWIHLNNIAIQPSELAKISLILILTLKYKNLLIPLILTAIPSILTFLEPDTGSTIIYLIIFISLLKYIKPNKKITIFTSVIASLFLLFNITTYLTNKDILTNIYGSKILYRIDRLISFKNQDNIQNKYSQIAIGSHKLLYIPENHNDFIFASIISKYPTPIFVLLLISFISIITYYLYNISHKKNTSNIINYMILNMLIFQIFYNILMNLSLVPIIGIPLPFLSYGGSYTISLYILIGLSINLNIHSNSSKVDMA